MKFTISLTVGLVSATSIVNATPFKRAENATLADCLGNKDVPVSWTDSADYAELSEPYNLRLPYKPVVVVLPTTNQHVQDAVKCAAEHDVKVQAKSGGHSYASFSSGGKDGSMMIFLQSFQNIQLDNSTGIVTVGGGVRLGNLAQGIWDQGKRALSHGTCTGVGIGGHFTHGGYGHTSRHWGLAMDHIVGADVVLADGRLVHASFKENKEIFWAIRGASESFGIITTFYLQTHEAPESVTYFSFQWGTLLHESKKTFTNSFLHFQKFAQNSTLIDDRISFGIYLDGDVFSLSGAFFGTPEEFNSTIKSEVIRSVPEPPTIVVQTYGWLDYVILMAGTPSLEEPLTGYDDHEDFFAKSITVPEADGGLTANAVNAFFDQVSVGTEAGFYVIINFYGGPGSNINNKDINFAAYSERDSLFVFQNYGFTNKSIDFVEGLNNAIIKAQPETHFGAYLNYVDPSYDAATAHDLYYGDELYQRLSTLKKKVDPQSVFWNPQAVGA